MGLIVVGCHEEAAPPTTAAGSSPAASATTATSATTASSASSSASADRAVASAPPPEPSPADEPVRHHPFPSCPHGDYCVAPPAVAPAASSAAPAPYTECAATTPPPSPGTHSSFDAEGTAKARAAKNKLCCYHWVELCPGGRPLRDGASTVLAALVEDDAWCGASPTAREGRAAAMLDEETRAKIAAHWAEQGRYEHASIASFAFAALDLLALGAPPALVSDAMSAGVDEARHAEVCFTIARRYSGKSVGPAPLATPTRSTPTPRSVALETLLEGAVNEAVASLQLSAAARNADHAIAGALAAMADDEARHATLAWRTLHWLAASFADARDALAEARSTLLDVPATVSTRRAGAPHPLAAHGLLGAHEQEILRAHTTAAVVLPCLDALLAATEASGITTPANTSAMTGALHASE